MPTPEYLCTYKAGKGYGIHLILVYQGTNLDTIKSYETQDIDLREIRKEKFH